MDRATFFKHFELLADTPDAVAKMRELVLQLAFSGGLSGKMRDDEGIPEGWEKRTIESIGASITSGFACSRNHQVTGGHVHLRTHNLSTLATLNFDLLVRIDPKMVDPNKATIRAGDILFNNTNSQELVGKTSLVDRDYDYGFSNHITRIRLKDDVFPGFVVFYFTLLRNSGYFARICTRWINQAAVNTDTLKKQAIPVPPLAEQKRIVAKVEELMGLCDELEARQQARAESRARLTQSAFTHLTAAQDEKAFRHHAGFLLQNSAVAFDDVAQLRQTILQLAVQGRLVRQDEKDEPAETILAHCQRGAKKLNIQTAEQGVIPACEAPFALPHGWQWARLRYLGCLMGGGTPSKSRSELWEGKLPWVSPKDMKVPYLLDAEDHISPSALDESAVKLIPPNSLLFVVRGMILSHSFPAAINKVEVTINQDMKALRPFVAETVEFLLLACRGFRNQMLANVERSTHGTCKLVTEKVTEFVIGLPPLAEQKRIVAKVGELLRLCDELESCLTQCRTHGEQLLAATLRQLLAG
jgi:type I restriction enzyme S subunit